GQLFKNGDDGDQGRLLMIASSPHYGVAFAGFYSMATAPLLNGEAEIGSSQKALQSRMIATQLPD
ncbi:MAG: hypothetical protein ACREUQ_02700, partial [Burkholderiales bacterium]